MIGLAPMEGVTDFPFRRWLSLCSTPAFYSTPFLRVTHTYPTSEIPVDFAPETFDPDYSDTKTPVLIQLMGPSPERISKVGSMILEKAPTFDINFGCPAPTVVGRGSGSALLANTEEFDQFVSGVYKELGPKNFSVKIRTGYEDSNNYEDIISKLSKFDLDKLTIHGRTKSQKYMGLADWDKIEYAASKLDYPVIGSGDIVNKKSYDERLNLSPSIDGVIVGRASLKNPWIFSQLENGSTPVPIDTILYALLTYGIFIELFFIQGYEKFKAVDLESGFIQDPLNTSEDWKNYLTNICLIAFGEKDYTKIDLGRRALSRIKMIWTYLKEKMPEEFQERTLLRAKTYAEFIEEFDKCKKASVEKNKSNSVYL